MRRGGVLNMRASHDHAIPLRAGRCREIGIERIEHKYKQTMLVRTESDLHAAQRRRWRIAARRRWRRARLDGRDERVPIEMRADRWWRVPFSTSNSATTTREIETRPERERERENDETYDTN